MLLNTLKNKKFKETQKKKHLKQGFIGFLSGFFGFYWAGFLMPTLIEREANKDCLQQ